MKNTTNLPGRIVAAVILYLGAGKVQSSIKFFTVLILLLLNSTVFAQTNDQRADNIENGTFNIFMSADQSYYKGNSASDNNPYGYGYWVTAHSLETLADVYQRTRNSVYKDRMKSIIAGIRKYNMYAAGTYHNDYYDDLEWLCLATFNCYNATKDPEFLDAVHQIWTEIKTGYANGAMSWKKGCTTPCNNSIANGPAIIIAVKLYQLEGDPANLQMAKDIHAWMKANVLNAQGGIWDSPGNLNPDWLFSYNSGMFIGACLELSIVTGTQSYIDDGITASEFMMNYRNYNGGVFFLNETGQGDGGLFKGIFAKYFTEFVRVGNLTLAQKQRYLRMINYTGDFAWANSMNKSSFLISPDWSALTNGSIDLSTQVSGIHLFESIASLNKVHVYQDINYAGFYSQLPVGTYTLAQLQVRGVLDNDITSLTIPIGYAVTVYENDNFGGASTTFSANTSWLADWNDRISSLKIVDTRTYIVNAYQDINYGGYAGGLDIGNYTLAQLQSRGILDNDITSFKITPGYKVTVYDGDNFTGASKDFTSDINWLADWNDKISSLKITTGPAIGNGKGLTANYFNGMNFETPVYNRIDTSINFNWNNGSPNTAVNVDGFSARWSGQIQPKYSDTYTFYLNTDNGRRLWINGQLIVDKWIDDWGIEYTGIIALVAGQKYDIKLEYFEDNGGASCKMEWSSLLQAREVVPQSQLYSNALPSISIASPANNASFTTPAAVTFNVATSDANGSVTKVDYYNSTSLIGTSTSSPFSYTWSNVSAGNYSITSRATDNLGGVTVSSSTNIVVKAATAYNILIQAEAYTNMLGVQTEATTDVGGTLDVGWIDTGDWMAYYTINFPATGAYTVQYRVASVSGGQLSMDLNAGFIQLGKATIPATGGWQNWTTITQTINVTAGTYNVGVFAQTGGWNINWFTITSGASGARIGQFDTPAITDVNSNYDLGSGVEIYPNPLDGELRFISTTSLIGGSARIINAIGVEVVNTAINSDMIDLSSLSAGMYTLLVNKDGNKFTKKFIKR